MPSRTFDHRRALLRGLDVALGLGYGAVGWTIAQPSAGGPSPVLAVAALLVSASVALCRQHPMAAYALSLAVHAFAVAFMIGTGTSGGGGLLAALATPATAYSLFRITSRYGIRRGLLALLPGFACPVAAITLSGSVGPLFVVPLALVPAVLIGYAERHHHAQLVRRHAELADLERDRARLSATEERIRIARELHDVVSHGMSVITVQAGLGRLVLDERPAQAGEALDVIESTGREMLAEMRQMLGVLRTDDEAPVVPAPGLADLDELVAQTRRAGVRVDLTTNGHPAPLPAGIDVAAYRIVQEALTNVVRHAGVDTCRVRIHHTAQELTLEITDEGRGAPQDRTGLGILGMQERARLHGGQVSAGPLPGQGFRVAARLPLPVLSTAGAPPASGPAGAAR